MRFLILLGVTVTGFSSQAFVPVGGGRSLLSCAEMINIYKASMPIGTEIRYCTGKKELVSSKCLSGTIIKEGEPALIVSQDSFKTEKKVEGIVALDKCKLIMGRVQKG